MSMISKQVEEIRHAAKVYSNYPLLAKMLNGAADTITLLSEKLHAANIERSAAYYNDGWIPCSERLPEQLKEVLISFDNYGRKDVTVATYRNYFYGEEWIANMVTLDMKSVTHWMPLPEPYKGSEV